MPRRGVPRQRSLDAPGTASGIATLDVAQVSNLHCHPAKSFQA